MRRFIRPPFLVTASLVLAAGCGPLHRGQQAAVVVFDNQGMAQADVYAVPQNGMEVRIGTVAPGRTETLDVTDPALTNGGPVTIVAHILASSRAPRTGPVSLWPGQRLEVTLPTAQNVLTVLPADGK